MPCSLLYMYICSIHVHVYTYITSTFLCYKVKKFSTCTCSIRSSHMALSVKQSISPTRSAERLSQRVNQSLSLGQNQCGVWLALCSWASTTLPSMPGTECVCLRTSIELTHTHTHTHTLSLKHHDPTVHVYIYLYNKFSPSMQSRYGGNGGYIYVHVHVHLHSPPTKCGSKTKRLDLCL